MMKGSAYAWEPACCLVAVADLQLPEQVPCAVPVLLLLAGLWPACQMFWSHR